MHSWPAMHLPYTLCRPPPPPLCRLPPAASRGWRSAAEDEEEGGKQSSEESGELPASAEKRPGGVGGSGAAQQRGEQWEEEEQGAAAGGDSRKRKHSAIVWHTPPKPGKAGMAHVGSSKGLDSLAAGEASKPAACGKPLSAADRAMEELLAFQQQQQQAAAGGSGGEGEEEEGGSDGQPYFKPSPSVSGSEEHEAAAVEQAGGGSGCRCGNGGAVAVGGVDGRQLLRQGRAGQGAAALGPAAFSVWLILRRCGPSLLACLSLQMGPRRGRALPLPARQTELPQGRRRRQPLSPRSPGNESAGGWRRLRRRRRRSSGASRCCSSCRRRRRRRRRAPAAAGAVVKRALQMPTPMLSRCRRKGRAARVPTPTSPPSDPRGCPHAAAAALCMPVVLLRQLRRRPCC